MKHNHLSETLRRGAVRTSRRLMALALFLATAAAHAAADGRRIDLSGLWRFQLDPSGFGMTAGSELYRTRLAGSIRLPGSTDEAGAGVPNAAAYVDRLSRRYEYVGMAWYQREVTIPSAWAGMEVELVLERCHWATAVYVDGQPAGTGERLSTPNRFRLTPYLAPGTHTLTICVDNRLKYPMDHWTHGTTEYTQTNWNGIVGRMELTARPRRHIARADVYPDTDGGNVRVSLRLAAADSAAAGTLALRVTDLTDGRTVAQTQAPVAAADTAVRHTLRIKGPVRLWDEFTPSLYRLEAVFRTAAGADTIRRTFGMRKVEQGCHHVRVNGRDVHLRGVLDCAVFPLTGYPATDTATWARIFRTVKDYGFNHVRFHSWCPPEAAFAAADAAGLYLQVELPMWIKDVGKYPARRDFFEKEMFSLLDAYGHHPSFLLYCNGNENEGDFAVLEDLIRKGRAYDDRHLYSASTARTHVKADQYYASHVTEKGWITVYEGQPSTDWDRTKESQIDVPVIAHEAGQRCMYPDFREMGKYKGVLEPRNFKVFQERLAQHGMLWQADDFFRATGAHTVLQYKEVTEALLRSSGSGGFQLLGLQDFPGQGSAFVGLLDAFWESKGLVRPEKFREWCGPQVLLARLPKRAFVQGEDLTAKFSLYQFGPADLGRGRLEWRIADEKGRTLWQGSLRHGKLARGGVDSIGCIRVPLALSDSACRLTLHARLGTLHNEWNIWVYPPADRQRGPQAAVVRDWAEARARLVRGERVLFLAGKSLPGRDTHFAGHFWNPVMFKWDPMIVGTRISAGHPALKDFPTSYYADWQWWDILNYGRAVDLTPLRGLTPVVQSVDTYEVNRKLGLAFEARVGEGQLFVLSADVETDLDRRPATRQLLYSLCRYVASPDFQPAAEVAAYELDAVFTPKTEAGGDGAEDAATRQLLNR